MTAAPNNNPSSAGQDRGDRCPGCASKTEFCICNGGDARRRAMTVPSAEVPVTRTRVKTLQLDRRCAFVSDAGRACRGMNAMPSMQCTKHTCNTPDCFEPKPSTVQHCSRHRVAGPPSSRGSESGAVYAEPNALGSAGVSSVYEEPSASQAGIYDQKRDSAADDGALATSIADAVYATIPPNDYELSTSGSPQYEDIVDTAISSNDYELPASGSPQYENIVDTAISSTNA